MFQCQEMPDGRVGISGELDINHAQEAKAAMCDLLRRDAVAVDLSGITEIDFIGVQVLLAARQEAEHGHRPFTLANGSAAVNQAFELLGVKVDGTSGDDGHGS